MAQKQVVWFFVMALLLVSPLAQIEAKGKKEISKTKKQLWRKEVLKKILNHSPNLSKALQKYIKAELAKIKKQPGENWQDWMSIFRSDLLKKIVQLDPQYKTRVEKRFLKRYWVGDILAKIPNLSSSSYNRAWKNPGLIPNSNEENSFPATISSDKLLEWAFQAVYDGEEGSITITSSYLWVKKNRRDHRRIQALLTLVRHTLLPSIELNVRVLEFPQGGYFKYFAKLKAGMVLNSALESKLQKQIHQKKSGVKLLGQYQILTSNHQRVEIKKGTIQTIVKGYYTDTAGVKPVINPQIGQVFSGFRFVFQPCFTLQKDHLLLDFTVEKSQVENIRTVPFKLAGEIQLPRIKKLSLGATIRIPLAKTLLLGYSQSGGKGLCFLLRARTSKGSLQPQKKFAKRNKPKQLAKLQTLYKITGDILQNRVKTSRKFYYVQEFFTYTTNRVFPRMGAPMGSPGSGVLYGGGGGSGLDFGGDHDDDPVKGLGPATLVEWVKDKVGEEAFANEEITSMEYYQGWLVVVQQEKIHKKIQRFLEKLQKNKYTQPGSFSTAFIRLPGGFLDKLAPRNRGKNALLSPGETAKIFQAIRQGKVKISHLSHTLFRPEQGFFVYDGVTSKYLRSYEVSSSGTNTLAFSLPDPEIGALRTGVFVSAKITPGPGKDQVDLKVVRCRLKKMFQIKTTYGKLELPQLSWEKVETTLKIPKGHSALLGGDFGQKGWLLLVLPIKMARK